MLLGLPNDQSLGVRLLGGIIHLNEGAKNYLGQRRGCAADTDARYLCNPERRRKVLRVWG